MLSKEAPKCPHCKNSMSVWQVPDFAFGDGLGWGSPYLYVCFNDECPSYKDGWDNIRGNFAHNASYRCMSYPDGKTFEFIPVFSPEGGTGQLISEQVLQEQERLKESIKIGFSSLADAYVHKDADAAMLILLDALQPARVRLKAADMIGDIGRVSDIESLVNNKYGNQLITEQVQASIKKIHKRHFTRECPFCAEIIKDRANICKHCGKEVAGL
ncbi:MAG: zinc ribbon domain-containing protein [Candidatus Magnetomorum sp.]|nr:zinc ribbon domain-containing protein [Candidatus Magnetomorum sp.]